MVYDLSDAYKLYAFDSLTGAQLKWCIPTESYSADVTSRAVSILMNQLEHWKDIAWVSADEVARTNLFIE